MEVESVGEDNQERENKVETVTKTGLGMEVEIGRVSSRTRSQVKKQHGANRQSFQVAQSLQAPLMIDGGGTVRYEPWCHQDMK